MIPVAETYRQAMASVLPSDSTIILAGIVLGVLVVLLPKRFAFPILGVALVLQGFYMADAFTKLHA